MSVALCTWIQHQILANQTWFGDSTTENPPEDLPSAPGEFRKVIRSATKPELPPGMREVRPASNSGDADKKKRREEL
jgi:hypothetical protein